VNLRGHQAGIGQSYLVHAVGNVGDPQAFKEFEDLLIFLGAINPDWYKIFAGP